MASLRVHPDRLEIHLTPAEKTLALRRENVVVQRENIRSVIITDDPWIWVRGIRAPGALVPLVIAVGVWKFHGGKDFLAIKRKRQAVVIDLVGDEYARLILSTNHAPDLIASLKLDAADADAAANAAAAETPAAAGDEPAATTNPPKPVKRTRTPKTATVPAAAAAAAPAPAAADPVAPTKPARRVRTAAATAPAEQTVSDVPAQAARKSAPAKPATPAKPAASTTAKASAESVDPAEPLDDAATA